MFHATEGISFKVSLSLLKFHRNLTKSLHVTHFMSENDFTHFWLFLIRSKLLAAHQGQRLPDSLHVVEPTPQVLGVQTIIRCVTPDFVLGNLAIHCSNLL